MGNRLALALVLAGSFILPASGQSKTPAPTKGTLTNVVNLNTATKADLLTLPGIGAVKADRILAFRALYGPFDRIEDILAVKGIGTKTLDTLRPRLTVTPAKGGKR